MPNARQILKGLKSLTASGLSAEWSLLRKENVFKAAAKINGGNFEEYCDFLSKLLSDSSSESKSVKDKIKEYTGTTKSPGQIAPLIIQASPALAKIVNPGQQDEESEDEGEPLISLDNLKLFMKNAKKKPQPFACAIGADGLIFTMNKAGKNPKTLANNVKRETGANKLSFGLTTLDGKTLVLDHQIKPLPGIFRKMKSWLKENKPLPANKVRLLENGVEVPMTDEELAEAVAELPMELAEYEPQVAAALKSGTGDSKKIQAVWAFANEKAKAGNYNDTMKALSALDKLLEAGTGEGEAGATAGESPATGANPADQFAARLKELIPQIKAAADATAGNDAKLKVSEAGVFARKKDFDQANALLDEAEQLLKQSSGDSPEAAKWKAYQEALAALFAKAMALNPANRTQLEAAWAMATEKADGGDHATALKIAAKLKPALDAVLKAGAGSEKEDVSGQESIVAFQKVRLEWEQARKSMQAKIKEFEAGIAKQIDTLGDGLKNKGEVLSAVQKKLSTSTSSLDERLIDKMDEALNASGEERAKFHQEARSIVTEYQNFVQTDSDFKKIFDNPFISTSLIGDLENTLVSLDQKLAASF